MNIDINLNVNHIKAKETEQKYSKFHFKHKTKVEQQAWGKELRPMIDIFIGILSFREIWKLSKTENYWNMQKNIGINQPVHNFII